MSKPKEDCFFYYEAQDMSASVPNCSKKGKMFGDCPCFNSDCDSYISKKDAYKLVVNEVNRRNEVKQNNETD